MAKNSGILETIGTIFGLVTGGPVGAAKGAFVGNLLGGGNFQDAFTSGIGSLFQTNPALGMASQAFNFGGSDGGGGSNNVFANAIKASTGGAQSSASQGGIPNVLSSLGIGQPTATPTNLGTIFGSMIAPQSGSTDNPLTALIAAMALNAMNRRTNPFTALEERQYQTGERNPDYRGTPAPDYRFGGGQRKVRNVAQGGMIEGPGTGKSDSIPAAIYQNGGRVQEARLSDGEFVMTADAVKGAGGGNRAKGAAEMYKMMNRLERRA